MVLHFDLILCAAVLLGMTGASEPILSSNVTIGHSHARCGEIFKCDTGTFRLMSFGEPTRPQRCTWLLAAPKATRYALKLDWPRNYYPTVPNLDSLGLLVTVLRIDNDTLVSMPLSSSENPIYFTGVVIVVTFYSKPNEQQNDSPLKRGFVVSFKADYRLDSEAESAAQHSEYALKLPDNMPFRHPENTNPSNRTVAEAVELSIIALIPRDNYSDSTGKVKIVYSRLHAGEDIGCALQSVSIYSFQAEKPPFEFRHKGTFCEDITSFTQATSDLTLVVVTSIRNANDTHRGFQMTFVD